MNIHLVAAARPNFMKIAPLYHALQKEDWAEVTLVHTGQHYDLNMSGAFFRDLQLSEPHIHLGIGSGTHAEQTAKVMVAYEKVVMDSRPDLVIVVGDVNSTMAATLVACKLGIVVAHLEAGLRSFDRTMPEEINRIVTDSLANLLWTPSSDADENLIREGVSPDKIERVGNVMIDSLEMLRSRIESEAVYSNFDLAPKSYGLITLHRPSNVDSPAVLGELCQALCRAARKIPLIFPVHPRTIKNLESYGLLSQLRANGTAVIMTEPLSYIPFMNLVFNSKLVVTDSGGLQEETTYLGIPCLTVRSSTERPITITHGTNRLCKPHELEQAVNSSLENGNSSKSNIELWDGRTSQRVVDSIRRLSISQGLQ